MTHTEVLGDPRNGAQFVFLNAPMVNSSLPRCFILGGAVVPPENLEFVAHRELSSPPLFLEFEGEIEMTSDQGEPWVVGEYSKPTEEDHLWLNARLHSHSF